MKREHFLCASNLAPTNISASCIHIHICIDISNSNCGSNCCSWIFPTLDFQAFLIIRPRTKIKSLMNIIISNHRIRFVQFFFCLVCFIRRWFIFAFEIPKGYHFWEKSGILNISGGCNNNDVVMLNFYVWRSCFERCSGKVRDIL